MKRLKNIKRYLYPSGIILCFVALAFNLAVDYLKIGIPLLILGGIIACIGLVVDRQ